MRDAWFAGYTPDLLCVVWVGYDDNVPIKLSGARAALPIWVDFMKGALAGMQTRPLRRARPRTSSSWTSTGDRPPREPGCPKVVPEAFIAGTEPIEMLPVAQPRLHAAVGRRGPRAAPTLSGPTRP